MVANMANRYYGECWQCKKEIIAFQSGFNNCNDIECAKFGGRGWCRFPARKRHLTPTALDPRSKTRVKLVCINP